MIPPANMIQDESGGKEDERDQNETPKSPTANASQQETKVGLLKRSLSFKTKSIRSKSADNFFRTSNENKTELLSDVSSSTGHLCNIGMSRNPLQVDSAGHCFMEHIFKKPTFCDVCNHMIVGNTAKHGLRCKACKMSLHHKCENGVGQQRCMGKLPKGFRRYYSSPLLIQEQYGCIKEVMPIACGNKVDPVYEALRFGTSLAQKAKRASGSESPHRNSVRTGYQSVLVERTEVVHSIGKGYLKSSYNAELFYPENSSTPNKRQTEYQSQLEKDVLKLNTYVALYGFAAQESHDLEIRLVLPAGDRILLADDSNDDWWKGVIEDRIGFFPAAFAHQLRAGDQVFRCTRTFIGCKEQGQITLKEGQICVSSEGERSGFIRVASGKKRGFVPCDVLEII
uniref:SH3 and cysteine rich domain n=1 Tax=Acanthochromis polyacanthus TaxID=80966 RepID=A0A3Q1GE31_9TELE